jgi:hypothetical protein
MEIDFRQNGRKWIAEVWNPNEFNGRETYPEDTYREINHWCYVTFGYQPRTAYHIFEFKKRSDLDWFLLRWQ